MKMSGIMKKARAFVIDFMQEKYATNYVSIL